MGSEQGAAVLSSSQQRQEAVPRTVIANAATRSAAIWSMEALSKQQEAVKWTTEGGRKEAAVLSSSQQRQVAVKWTAERSRKQQLTAAAGRKDSRN